MPQDLNGSHHVPGFLMCPGQPASPWIYTWRIEHIVLKYGGRQSEDYSDRAFTRLSDWLPALSVLASELEEILGHEYVARMWNEDLILDLLWTHDHRRRSDYRDRDSLERYEAPPSSWASYMGASPMRDAEKALLNKDYQLSSLSAQVLEAKAIPEGLNPKERVVRGFIRLKGREGWFKDTSSAI